MTRRTAPLRTRRLVPGTWATPAVLATACAALLAGPAAIPAWAQSEAAAKATPQRTPDEIRRELYTLESQVSLGIGHVSDDSRRFGMHNGLNRQGAVPLLDIDHARRDDATGTWFKLTGRNLGLDTRELRLVHERQGDWAWWFQGSQFSRREPLIVNTGLQGVGTSSQVVSATAPRQDLNLRMEHDIFALGVRKFLWGGVDLQVSFKQDEARGSRMLGRGTSNVIEFLAEPIDRITRQWGVTASWGNARVQLSGGYNGSSHDNAMPVLSATGGNNATSAFGPRWDIALPPANSAHQWHLSGGLNFGSHHRVAFKASQTVALQNEAFDPVFVRLAGTPDSLNGRVVTTLGYIELSMRPLRQLDLLATLRHEDRDDQTPEVRWLAEAAPANSGSFGSAGVTGLNKPRSLRQNTANLELGWQLGEGQRLTAGVQQDELRRNVSQKYRRVAFRERNDETTTRLEFRRAMSDVLNGSLALQHVERTGSDYIPDTYDARALTNQVNQLIWADRSRDRVRLSTDWTPAEDWSLQLLFDRSQDHYAGRALGPRVGEAESLSVDLHHRPNERWEVTAWATHERLHSRQSTRSDRPGAAASGFDTVWDADLQYQTRAGGLSVKGRLRSGHTVGAELSSSVDQVRILQRQTGGTGTLPLPDLPEYHYRSLALKLHAEHPLGPDAGLRLELGADRRRSNDWTWDNWTYNGAPAIATAQRTSDGTIVRLVPRENVVFVGFSYRLRWR
jgi:MtrB/PioB family decaheme-associated outer membrane protein